jgi:hypothetical protein
MQLASYTLITATHCEGKEKKRKTAASATTALPKGKKMKVLTHRPQYIETTVVPEFGEGTSSAVEAKQAALVEAKVEGSTAVPKMPIVGSAEAKDGVAKEPELEKTVMLPKILSPPVEAELPKVTKAPATTPKRRRMASVLDAVIETTKALTPAPEKKFAEAATAEVEAEVVPLVSVEMKPAANDEGAKQESLGFGITTEKEIAEEAKSPGPEALSENLDFIIRHASGKRLSEGEIAEANHYAQKLKYPKGALVFNGTDKDDSYTVSRTTKRYLSAGRWLKVWDFQSSRLAFPPCQRMTSRTALHTTA